MSHSQSCSESDSRISAGLLATLRASVVTRRQNQSLEEASVCMQEEQDRLQHHASNLADQLQAVMHEKRHRRRLSFDAETPVDKTLNYLQSVISVRAQAVLFCACTSVAISQMLKLCDFVNPIYTCFCRVVMHALS